MSTAVLAALLSALLLLSPGTARAVAHVLAENGVTLPANVVRVLDALPSDPTRDTVRRDDETVCAATSEADATLEDEPDPVEWVYSLPSTADSVDHLYNPFTAQIREPHCVAAPRRAAYSRATPRAPPV